VLQGIDAAGKDGGAIRSAFSGVSPQGVRVRSFRHRPRPIWRTTIPGPDHRRTASPYATNASTRLSRATGRRT
jgi:hypothetical protein